MRKVQPSVQLLISGGRKEPRRRAEGPACGEGGAEEAKASVNFHISY